jgi:hypothetical protein
VVFLYGQGFQVRLRDEIAIAPAPRSHARLRDRSGVARSCFTNDEFVSHDDRVARQSFRMDRPHCPNWERETGHVSKTYMAICSTSAEVGDIIE